MNLHTLTKKHILIVGADGQLAQSFIEKLHHEKIGFTAKEYKDLDLTDYIKTANVIADVSPDIIINCAAYNLVDDAEERPEIATKVNRDAVGHLAKVCNEKGIFLVHYSSDYVFDGQKGGQYTEDDTPNPLNQYGRSKLEGEQVVQNLAKQHLIFRLSWVFGFGQANFLYKLNQWSQGKSELQVVTDEISVPTFTEDIVEVTLQSLEKGLVGLYHLTNTGHCSRYGWAKCYFEEVKKDISLKGVTSEVFYFKAKRPMQSVMSNLKLRGELGVEIPTWQDAVKRYVKKIQVNQASCKG